MSPLYPLIYFAAVTVSVGLAYSWRSGGWMLLFTTAFFATLHGYQTRGRVFCLRPFVAAIGATGVIGIALVLASGGLPFRGCGSSSAASDAYVARLLAAGNTLTQRLGDASQLDESAAVASRRPRRAPCGSFFESSMATKCYVYDLGAEIRSPDARYLVTQADCVGNRWVVTGI